MEQQRAQIGHRVRHARESLGWSQAALARRAGVSPNTVLAVENGKHTTQPAKLRQVFDALGLTPLGDVTWLNADGVPADAQTFLTVAAARLAAMNEDHRMRLIARIYPMLLVDDLEN